MTVERDREMKIEDEMKRALLAYKSRIPSAPVQIMVPEGRNIHFFKAADILYLQGDYDNVKLIMRRGKEKVIRGRRDRIAELFEKHGFLRIQVSYLVNGRYILGMDKKQVVLKGNVTFKISPKYQKKVFEELKVFQKEAKKE